MDNESLSLYLAGVADNADIPPQNNDNATSSDELFREFFSNPGLIKIDDEEEDSDGEGKGSGEQSSKRDFR